ncbi:hypothetical protein ACLOJK_001753 [Asimina triloba]
MKLHVKLAGCGVLQMKDALLFCVMAIVQAKISPLPSTLRSSFASTTLDFTYLHSQKQKCTYRCKSSSSNSENEYLIDAPESIGDGFSFSGGLYRIPCISLICGTKSFFKEHLVYHVCVLVKLSMDVGTLVIYVPGKYSEGPSRSDEWFKQGKIIKAHPVLGGGGKAKDPIFGLTMGSGSQASADVFRWFCVEEGTSASPLVLLIHGFPSQHSLLIFMVKHAIEHDDLSRPSQTQALLKFEAYSYRKVIPTLSKNHRAIAFDWLEYTSSLESLISELATEKLCLVVQGYFAPVVVKYASSHQKKLKNIVLINPPDPLRASDRTLTSCGPYAMKEEDAMVYRRPYLTSGSSGFALTALSRAMKKELKASFTSVHSFISILDFFLTPISLEIQPYVEEMRAILSSKSWKVSTTICWGQRDRWLSYEGVEDFCKGLNHRLVELPMAGHHVQEDRGEELGQILAGILARS